MEILNTVTVDQITLNVNDSFDIGNNVSIVIKEIFSIEDQVYITLVTVNEPMLFAKIKDSDEIFTPNRYINPVKLWVSNNKQLFTTN